LSEEYGAELYDRKEDINEHFEESKMIFSKKIRAQIAQEDYEAKKFEIEF
jgi:hypothetical protein